jgi:hypothetical protein
VTRLLTADGHWRVRRDMPGSRWANPDIEAGLVIETPGRWLRLFAVWGEAPGSRMMNSHLTVWRTDCGPGEVHGWNLRAGWWPAPCLTVLCHTRPARAWEKERKSPPW